MIDVVLVRHGATSWSGLRYCGRSDPPLSAEGLAGAASLAAALALTLVPDVLILTSPARRALETAAAIAAAAGVDMEIDGRWREADFGIAEGRTFAELTALQPDLADALARGRTCIDWPGGETAAELRGRVTAAWTDLTARGRPTVVVSHAGALRHALALTRSLPADAVELQEPASAIRVRVPSDRAGRSGTVLGSLP